MKQNMYKVGALIVGVATAVLPAAAFADGFSTSTAQASVNGAITDLGTVLANVIPTVLGILVALLALGMGIRYVRKHVSGRKF